MAQLAILAAIQIGLAVAGSFLTPKPKQEKIDRGKQDDLRFTIVEEGAFIPRVYGRGPVRLAGNLFWGTETRERVNHTNGSSGGKKGRGATPPTDTFSYDKSFAALVCEGPIRAFVKIKEGEQDIFNQITTGGSAYYEAESASNTRAGGATIVTDATLLSGRKVTLPPGGSVQFNGVRSNVATVNECGIYYQANAAIPVTVRINGTTNHNPTLPDTDNELDSVDVAITLNISGSNTIKITNNHATESIHIDRIFVFPFFEEPADPFEPRPITGIVNEFESYPTDPNDPSSFYNRPLRTAANNQATGTVAAGGQAGLELYLGTFDQPVSPTIVAEEGAGRTPAHRGLANVVFNTYLLKTGQLENLTFYVEPLLEDLADILAAEFKLRGATDSLLDFEAVRGTIVEGLYIDRLASLTETLKAMEFFYGFDIVPEDGKIKAVPRGGASKRTIPFNELLAHEEGSERPAGVRIEHVEAGDLPNGIYIAFVDSNAEQKDFHTGSQFIPLGFGPAIETESINLPIVVSNPDDVIAAGKRYLFGRQLEKDGLEFALDPKHSDLSPTDVVTLELEQKTIDARIISTQTALPGITRVKALPEKAGLYNQTGIGQIGTGSETGKVAHPANSFLYIADLPTLNDADRGRLVYYAGICPRGIGDFQGGFLYEETVEDSGEFDRRLIFPRAATIGELVSSLPAVTDPSVVDTTNSLVLDLYFDEDLFESRPLADVQANDVNMVAIGSGDTAEVIKFADATYSAGTFPFVRRVTLTNLIRGHRGTQRGATIGVHAAGTAAVFYSDAVQSHEDRFDRLGLSRKFKAVTVAQALQDASVTNFTNHGLSLAPPQVTDVLITKDALSDWRIAFSMEDAPPNTASVEVWTSADRTDPDNRKRTLIATPGTTQAALLAGTTGDYDPIEETTTQTNHAFKNNFANLVDLTGFAGTSISAITEPWQRFDFEMAFENAVDPGFITDLANELAPPGSGFLVALHERATAEGPYSSIPLSECPLSVEWILPADYWETYPPGTVREIFRSYETVLLTRDGVDAGGNPFTIVSGEVTEATTRRQGQRYTFSLNGGELAIYKNFVPAGGNKHLVKITPAAINFPLRLSAMLTATSRFYVRNVMFGGARETSTIYSAREQRADFANTLQTKLYLRIYKDGPVPGIPGVPLDIETPTIP